MQILKYLILILVIYLTGNIFLWGYQEYIYYDDIQSIKSISNTINIARVNIEETQQNIEVKRKELNMKKENLDKLILEKKYIKYNDLIEDYNKSVESLNQSILQYEDLVKTYNYNIQEINRLLVKSGTRHYIFPIPSYEPDLYEEIQ